MTNKSNKKRWLWGIGVLILLAIFFIKIPVFVFEFEDRTYFLLEDSFQLKWIHSVEKEEWIETYEQQGNEILLLETHFKTFGAGVPSIAKDTELTDGFVKMKMDIRYPELYLTVSENVETTIISEDREIPIYNYANDYDVVHITIRRIYLWELLLGGKL
ncbi:DUF1850 domain-containing protein [Lysinibacillus telephonicus]|uniref:DUF1850 domain-containing protein n=1 Tax=Lysinibacillus telephonicus TaxID=1714840 RepID=A0A431UWZ6_9BACI|nr:DUF1850 domain-containing protein [Lysinibacillus telephonicus]RTQ96062.1 DUF1850 domain-containing protein [Lysinibacillus telephonicus]